MYTETCARERTVNRPKGRSWKDTYGSRKFTIITLQHIICLVSYYLPTYFHVGENAPSTVDEGGKLRSSLLSEKSFRAVTFIGLLLTPELIFAPVRRLPSHFRSFYTVLDIRPAAGVPSLFGSLMVTAAASPGH